MMDVDYGIGRGIDADADADMGEMNFVFLYDAVVAVKRYLSRSYYYDFDEMGLYIDEGLSMGGCFDK